MKLLHCVINSIWSFTSSYYYNFQFW